MEADKLHCDTRLIREEQQYRRLGTRKPSCNVCEEREPAALTGTDPNIVCYECLALKKGKSTVEQHHMAGQHNDSFTVPIPANEHRILSDMQRDWPNGTLRNPDCSPLRQAAATIRGWLDILRLMIERVLGWIPAYLEQLDDILTGKLGNQYWLDMNIQRSIR